MDRWACVDVRALPLQLLLRWHPDWRDQPVVVVDRDEPTGVIQWVNEAAYRARVLPGRRFAEGLSLARGLRAGVVPEVEVEDAIEEIVECLRDFSPAIEPDADQPGVVWLDATSMEGLFESFETWAGGVVGSLAERSLHAGIVVGWSRFGTFALVRSRTRGGAQVVATRADEDALVDAVALDRLRLPAKLRDVLARLGITTVAGLRALPPGGLGERFGRVGAAIQTLLTDQRPALLVAKPDVPPPVETFEIEPDELPIDVETLLFLLGQRLARMRVLLLKRSEAITALRLELSLDRAPVRLESVSAAEPTLDEDLLLELLRLRIEAQPCAGPVIGFVLQAQTIRATRKQLDLFAERPKRDLAAANRGLARLRAEFGEEAVLQAKPRAGHLPEAKVEWGTMNGLAAPSGTESNPDPKSGRLVRRMLLKPRAIRGAGHAPYDWCMTGLSQDVFGGQVRDHQAILTLHGPYPISGGWWVRPVHRDYYYAETRDGALLWLYEDRERRKWFVQGVID